MPSATGWSGSSPADRPFGHAALDDPALARCASREQLSLLLIDSRNRLLQLLGAHESAAALHIAAEAGVTAEYWIARHLQRGRGEQADPLAPRLAGIEPRAEHWPDAARPPPAPDTLRAYLAQTLETTLELLATADDDDRGLYVYRLALALEDRCAERLAQGLVGQGVALPALQPALAASPPARGERPPLWLPAQTVHLGAEPGPGFVPGNERWAHAVPVPDFEIDAQVVSWARVVEFAEDGGYDRPELWTAAGWQWVQAGGHRAPVGVAQLRGGAVLLQRGAALWRAPGGQPATGLSRHEAEAWCRWAGRRLPTEPEWEAAARAGAGQGFVWGDVLEWVAGRPRPWPGHQRLPGDIDPLPAVPDTGQGVLRGAPWMSRLRTRRPTARRFQAPGQATILAGFRSCAQA